MPWGYTVNCASILFILTLIPWNTGYIGAWEWRWSFWWAIAIFSNTTRTAHTFYSAAREFNSKAAKAIWDFNGIVSLACPQSTQSPTSDQASMLLLDTYLESVLQVSLIQDLLALPLPLNYWPHGTNAKVNWLQPMLTLSLPWHSLPNPLAHTSDNLSSLKLWWK